MPKLIVLYPPPADVATFERRYEAEHAPMVLQKIPGLKKFLAAKVLGAPAGAAPYQRVAELYAVLCVVGFALNIVAPAVPGLAHQPGLGQRITFALYFGWFLVMACHLFSVDPRARSLP